MTEAGQSVGDGLLAAAILAVMWWLLGGKGRVEGRPLGFRTLLLVAGLWYAGYTAIRLLVPSGSIGRAAANARGVEVLSGGAGVERLVIEVLRPVVSPLGVYYNTAHLIVTGFTICWLARRRGERLRQTGPWLAVCSTVALFVFWALPVAPPRMFGFGAFGPVPVLAAGAVPFAAFPSLHCAWALWCDWSLWPSVRKLRPLLGLHTALTVLCTLGTGNHWLIDVAAGFGLLAACKTVCELGRRPGRMAGGAPPVVVQGSIPQPVIADCKSETPRFAAGALRNGSPNLRSRYTRWSQ